MFLLFHLFNLFTFFEIRAEKRAAWRQQRLENLEKEAAQQSMNKLTDDLTKKNEVS